MSVEVSVTIDQSFTLTDDEYDAIAAQATRARVSVEDYLQAETGVWWDRIDDPFVRVEIEVDDA